jgi:hypothetical protein
MSRAEHERDRARGVWENAMGAHYSRQQAARCLQLAEDAPSARLKVTLLAQAREWNCLAEDQEWLEKRIAERQSREPIARFPTLYAVLSAHSGASLKKRKRRYR